VTPEINEELAEIMGICLGDGCISINKRYSELAILGDINEERIYYDEWVIPLLNRNLFLPLTNKEIKAKEYPKMGVYGIIAFNKNVVDYLLLQGLKPSPKISHGVPKIIKESDFRKQKRFIRGVFDTDGSVFFEKNYASKSKVHSRMRIKLESVSKELVNDCIEICRDMGYKPYRRKPYKGKKDLNMKYGFTIQRKEDLIKWIEEIGFKSPKHATKIEIWKNLGYCPPYTTLDERMVSLSAKLKTVTVV
jgi:hypothetical protein